MVIRDVTADLKTAGVDKGVCRLMQYMSMPTDEYLAKMLKASIDKRDSGDHIEFRMDFNLCPFCLCFFLQIASRCFSVTIPPRICKRQGPLSCGYSTRTWLSTLQTRFPDRTSNNCFSTCSRWVQLSIWFIFSWLYAMSDTEAWKDMLGGWKRSKAAALWCDCSVWGW